MIYPNQYRCSICHDLVNADEHHDCKPGPAANLQAAEARIAELEKERGLCTWHGYDDDIWHPECNDAPEFTCINPVENHYVYCPFCGNWLVRVSWSDEPESEGE